MRSWGLRPRLYAFAAPRLFCPQLQPTAGKPDLTSAYQLICTLVDRRFSQHGKHVRLTPFVNLLVNNLG